MMERNSSEWLERFYFYNSDINPHRLIEKYAVAATEIRPTAGALTNALGVIINPRHFPGLLDGKEGQVEGLPIPANWHADMAEFGAALRAVDLAKERFTMVELGCGWGCWMNITGVAARRKGLKVTLIGVEGDEDHLGFAREALRANGFSSDEYRLHEGVAAATKGFAVFPKQEVGGASWGSEPIFDLGLVEADVKVATGKYLLRKQWSLEELGKDCARIDLLHVDIQGGERTLIPAAMPFLNEKVAYLLIGTHSRQIEGEMFDCLLKAGWVLEIERPAWLKLGAKPYVTVDGVQGWRNPRLLTLMDVVEPVGSLEWVEPVERATPGALLSIPVKVTNGSKTDWESRGERPVNISYHWLNADGSAAVFDGERTPLPGLELCSGASAAQRVKVIAPTAAGEYRLCVTLVQEQVRWFEEPSFKPATATVRVANGG